MKQLKIYAGLDQAKHKLSPMEVADIIKAKEESGVAVEEGFYKEVEYGTKQG